MAVKTYYVPTTADGNFAALVDGVAQTAASRADGWTVAKLAATNESDFDAGTKQASGTFATGQGKPATLLTGTTANAFKTPAALTGVFDIGNWVFTFGVRATTASSQAGRMVMTIWRGTNAAGTNATLIASTRPAGSGLQGTVTAALSTTVDGVTACTWTPGVTVTLNNEFLFFCLAWQVTTASGSNNGDVVIRTGSGGTAGSYLTTPNYTANQAVSNTDHNGTVTESAAVGIQIQFPSTSLIDSFNRADGVLTSPYVASYGGQGIDQIVSNQVVPTGGSNFGTARTDSLGADTETWFTVVTVPAPGSDLKLCGRWTPGSGPTGYYARINGTSWHVSRQDSGSSGDLDGGGATRVLSAGDKIGLRVAGNSIQLVTQPGGTGPWFLITQATDSTYTAAGGIGWQLPTGTVIDDLGGGALLGTQVPASDTNGATTEAGAATGKLSGTDANGTVTEAISSFSAVLTDTSPINEIEVTALRIGDTDAGVATDSASVASPLSASDAKGATTESSALVAQVSGSESRTATESASYKAPVPAADSNGLVTESQSIVAVNYPTSGLVARFDASQLALADGAAVNVWPNAAGGFALSLTGGAAPIARAGVNGLQYKTTVRFASGQAGFVQAAATGVDKDHTLLVVARMWSGTNYQRLIGGTSPPVNFLIGWHGGSEDVAYMEGWLDGNSTGVPATTNWHLYSTDGASASFSPRLFSDGVQIRGGAGATSGWQNVFSINAVFPAQSSDCEVAEVLLYNRQLSDVERQQAESYLRQKWFRLAVSSSDSNGPTTEGTGLVVTVAEPATYGSLMSYATYAAIPGAVATYTALAGSPFPQIAEATALVLTVTEPDQIGTYQAFQSTYAVSYTQLGTTFGSYAALQGGTLPLPNLVETATITQSFSTADSNGPVTETATVVARPADTDSGSGIDTASLVAKATVTDSDGATTETAAPQAQVAAADASGATTETASARAVLAGADSNGSITEAQATVAKLTDTDANTTTELGTAVAQITPVSSTDSSGATTEAQALVAGILVSDGGTDSESTTLATFNQLASSDTNGATTESAAVKAVLAGTDADGATTEAQGLVVGVSSADTDGATTENGSLATFNAVAGSDSSGATTELATVVVVLLAADGGTDSEATAIRVTVIADTNGVVELATVVRFNPFALSDAGLTMALDTIGIAPIRKVSDPGMTLADSIAKTTSGTRQITDSGLAMTDSLARLQALVRSLADTALTVADSLVRAAANTRLLSDTGIAVADSIATKRARALTDTAVALVETLALRRGITLTDTALGSLGSATDSFNRADGGLGSSWTTQSTDPNTLQIAGNRVVATGGLNNQATSLWNANAFGATQFSEARISDVIPNLNWLGVAVRVQSSGNAMYLLIAFNNGGTPLYQLYRRNGGTYTQVGSSAVGQTINVGDVFRLEVNGNALTAKLNGTTIISATDATVPSGGSPGIAIYTAAGGLGGSLDDWNGGYYGAPMSDVLVPLRPAGLSDNGLVVSDSLVRTLVGSRTLADVALTIADVVSPRGALVALDTGLSMTDSLRKARLSALADTALTLADSLKRVTAPKPLTDTGLVVADTLTAQHLLKLADTALALSDTLRPTHPYALTDAGLVLTDSLAVRHPLALTDAGLTFSDVLRLIVAPKALTDIALTLTDTLRSAHPVVLTDAGLVFAEALARRLQATRPLSDVGLALADVVAPSSGRSPVVFDTALAMTDAVRSAHALLLQDTALSGADALRRLAAHPLADVGLAVADSLTMVGARARTLTDTGLALSDVVALRAARVFADVALTTADSIKATLPPRFVSDTGLAVTDALRLVAGRSLADTALALTSTLTVGGARKLADTALTSADALAWQRAAPRTVADTALVLVETLRVPFVKHGIADTALVLIDVIPTAGQIPLLDVGLTVSDALTLIRRSSRAITDTGLTVTDVLRPASQRRLTDIALVLTDTLTAGGGQHLVDAGLTVADLIASRRITAKALADTGLSLGDSIALPLRFRARSLTDSGIVVAEALPIRLTRAVTDTGLTLTDLITKSTRPLAMHDAMPTLTDSLSLTAMRSLADVALDLLAEIGAGLPPQKLYDTGLTVADEVALTRASVLADVALALEDLIETAFTKASITDPTQFELATTQLLVVLAASSLAITLVDGRRELVVDESVREVGLEESVGGREAELVLVK